MKKSVEHPTTATRPPPNVFPVLAGNLHADVTQGDLYTLFSTIGPVQSVRLCRNRYTGKSLCYGYVNFFESSKAVAAVRTLDGMDLRGKPMRVRWVEKNHVIKNHELGKLVVKNLDLKVNEGKLGEIFGVYGMIRSCHLDSDDDGNSKGVGFVEFNDENSALAALSALNGSVLGRKKLTVTKCLKKAERNEANVYVKNLDESFTASASKERFSTLTERELKDACASLDSLSLADKPWLLKRPSLMSIKQNSFDRVKGSLGRAHQQEPPEVSNLFVGTQSSLVSENELKEVLGEFGRLSLAEKPKKYSMLPRPLLIPKKDSNEHGRLSLADKPKTYSMLPRPLEILKKGSNEQVMKQLSSCRQRKRDNQPESSSDDQHWNDETLCVKPPKRAKK